MEAVTPPSRRPGAPREHALLHPGKERATGVGVVGEVHPAVLDEAWGAFELELEPLFEAARDPVRYEDVITYPAVNQDLAFSVPEDVPAETSSALHTRRPGPACAKCASSTSTAARRSARAESPSPSRSLSVARAHVSDEDAAELRQRIAGSLRERFDAELRA